MQFRLFSFSRDVFHIFPLLKHSSSVVKTALCHIGASYNTAKSVPPQFLLLGARTASW